MSLDFALIMTVVFFSKKRRVFPCLTTGQYCPHIVVKGDDEYLGVCFVDGSSRVFDMDISAAALPIYEGVGYEKLKPGIPFWIREGACAVGEGIIYDIYPHQSYVQMKEMDEIRNLHEMRSWKKT